jgi:hypothetical protein
MYISSTMSGADGRMPSKGSAEFFSGGKSQRALF